MMNEFKEIILAAAVTGITFACTPKVKALLYNIANRKDDTNVENHNGN